MEELQQLMDDRTSKLDTLYEIVREPGDPEVIRAFSEFCKADSSFMLFMSNSIQASKN